MMEKQVVGERASEYLDGKASSKAGPSMRDLPQIVVFLSTPSRTFCPAMPSYFRRWPMAACGCDCGSVGLSMIGDPAKGMLLYSAFGLVAQASSMIGPRFPLPPHRGPSSDASDAIDVATAVRARRCLQESLAKTLLPMLHPTSTQQQTSCWSNARWPALVVQSNRGMGRPEVVGGAQKTGEIVIRTTFLALALALLRSGLTLTSD